MKQVSDMLDSGVYVSDAERFEIINFLFSLISTQKLKNRKQSENNVALL
jgi:hypothetical protein